jgi:glycosyltransferase involved in cell wall biosynthesis
MASVDLSGGAVTVIVCARNAAATLGGALASIAGQTIAPGAIVVVDDASSDDTAGIAAAWADRLPITLVRLTEHGGAAQARRVAIDRSETELVAILDADDVWLPEHVATLLAAYRATPGLVTARELLWVPGVGVGRADEHDRAVPRPPRQLRGLLDNNFVFSGTLFARDAYDAAGGYRAELRRSEDWDLWIRMVRNGVPVVRAPHPTVLYRLSPQSASFGAATVAEDVAVLRHALDEARDAHERRWVRASLRRFEARLALSRSLDAAASGHVWRARALAVRGSRGRPRVRAYAAVVVASPRRALEARTKRLADLTRRLRL